MRKEGADHGRALTPVLLTHRSRARQVQAWRARAVRALDAAQRLADEAWIRGEHEVSRRWEGFCLRALKYAEACRRALERIG